MAHTSKDPAKGVVRTRSAEGKAIRLTLAYRAGRQAPARGEDPESNSLQDEPGVVNWQK